MTASSSRRKDLPPREMIDTSRAEALLREACTALEPDVNRDHLIGFAMGEVKTALEALLMQRQLAAHRGAKDEPRSN